MTTAEEATLAKTPIASDLAEGVQAISLNQVITFVRYVRLVLPLDGYVFWVKAEMVGPSALYNGGRYNGFGFNQAPRVRIAAPTFSAKGSLHYATDTRQEETENYSANAMVFTSEQEVNDLNEVAPGELWIATFQGVRFAFSSRSSFYKQADLWHYKGFAIYADMETQVIDTMAGFDSHSVVVSNSLPAWLGLNGYNPIAPPRGLDSGLVLYPSFLVPQNLPPPYAAVHVVPDGTRAMAMAPLLSANYTHSQLCADRVRVTLWGTRNSEALDFIDTVNQYTIDTEAFGLTNSPVVQDEKRTQSELGTIAMKKTITFEVSYNQSRINNVARQIIRTCVPNFYVGGVPA